MVRKREERKDVRAIFFVTNDLPQSLYAGAGTAVGGERETLDSGYYHFKASLGSWKVLIDLCKVDGYFFYKQPVMESTGISTSI